MRRAAWPQRGISSFPTDAKGPACSGSRTSNRWKRLPGWAQFLANFNPLYHCVELVRHAAFGWAGWTDLLRLGALVVFGLVLWRIAIHAMTRKLID